MRRAGPAMPLLLVACIDALEGATCESDEDCLDYVCQSGRCTDRERAPARSGGSGGQGQVGGGGGSGWIDDGTGGTDPVPTGPEIVVTGLEFPFDLWMHRSGPIWTMAGLPGSFGRVRSDGTSPQSFSLEGPRFFVDDPSSALHGDTVYASADELGLIVWDLSNDTFTQRYVDSMGYAKGPVAADAAGVYWVTDDRASGGQAIRAMAHGGGTIRTIVAGLEDVDALVVSGGEGVVAAYEGIFAIALGGGPLRPISAAYRHPTALVATPDAVYWAETDGLHRYVPGAASASRLGDGFGLDVATGLAVDDGRLYATTGGGPIYEVTITTGATRSLADTDNSGDAVAVDGAWVWFFGSTGRSTALLRTRRPR